MSQYEHYHVPAQSKWPAVGALGLFLLVIGLVTLIHATRPGHEGSLTHPAIFICAGAGILIYMIFGWFGHVIQESMDGLYSRQMDRSFRMGMMWFIFSEVMFFAAFFGALFYIRMFALPWLEGLGSKPLTSALLWPNFSVTWPLMVNPDPKKIIGPLETISWSGVPLLNTIILLTSGVTVTWAHWALKMHKRTQLNIAMALTCTLGVTFLIFQMHEYHLAYTHMGLTLNSGIYGSTFFMLTGFHGMHVTLGSIMLFVILLRCLKGHFTKEHHFGFEAVAWYWHFVDVVWLGLFIFVYIF